MTALPEDEQNRIHTEYRKLVEEMRRNMERHELRVLFGVLGDDITKRASFERTQFRPAAPPVEPPHCPNGQHDWGEYQEREEWTVKATGPTTQPTDQLERKRVLVSTCHRCGTEAALDL